MTSGQSLLLQRLEPFKLRQTGANKYLAFSPARPDEQSPSLNIAFEGENVLINDFGGPTEAVLGAIDLTWPEILSPKAEAPKKKGRGPLVATYLYESMFGKLAFKSCRYQFPGSADKTFLLFRPDGNGGWIADLKGVERIPFGLPELMAASPDETVFILEGEKIVLLARTKLGIVATTSCGGHGQRNQWKVPSFSKAMKGRNVAIVPDLDKPGEEFAATVAASLVNVAKSVKIVRLPLKNKGDDMEQWLAAGGKREQLLALVEAAPLYDPTAESTTIAAPEEPFTMCLEGIKPEATTWLWYARFAVGKITVLDGAPGSGKSTMTCDAAARVSRGLPFPMDRHARSAGGVIFIAGEDGVADTVVPRLLAAGADLSKCFVWPANKLPYLPDGAPDIAKEIQRRQARLLIIDPITALFARDLSTNSDQDVRCALTPLAVAAEELGCCVLLLRHLNKRSGASAFDRGGGSVGIGALARVVLLVARDQSDPDQRILAAVKVNLTRPPRSLKARILDVNGIGKVDWGEECDITADSLVAEPAPERKGKADGAADWLRQTLVDGQWHRQKEIETAAKEEGIAPRTLRRAREEAGVTCRQMDGGWWWRLPDAQRPLLGQVATWPPGERAASDGQERINNISRLGVPDGQEAKTTHTPPDGHLAIEAELSDFDDGVLT